MYLHQVSNGNQEELTAMDIVANAVNIYRTAAGQDPANGIAVPGIKGTLLSFWGGSFAEEHRIQIRQILAKQQHVIQFRIHRKHLLPINHIIPEWGQIVQ